MRQIDLAFIKPEANKEKKYDNLPYFDLSIQSWNALSFFLDDRIFL